MASFQAEGRFVVKVKQAIFAESKFNKNDSTSVDVAILVETLDGAHSGWWQSELSKRYGVGNNAGKQQWEMTLDSLERIGWEHGTNLNPTTLQSLVGKEIDVTVEKNEYKEKTYYDVKYLGSFGPKPLADNDVAERMKSLLSDQSAPNQTAETPAQSAPPVPPVGANPFS